MSKAKTAEATAPALNIEVKENARPVLASEVLGLPGYTSDTFVQNEEERPAASVSVQVLASMFADATTLLTTAATTEAPGQIKEVLQVWEGIWGKLGELCVAASEIMHHQLNLPASETLIAHGLVQMSLEAAQMETLGLAVNPHSTMIARRRKLSRAHAELTPTDATHTRAWSYAAGLECITNRFMQYRDETAPFGNVEAFHNLIATFVCVELSMVDNAFRRLQPAAVLDVFERMSVEVQPISDSLALARLVVLTGALGRGQPLEDTADTHRRFQAAASALKKNIDAVTKLKVQDRPPKSHVTSEG